MSEKRIQTGENAGLDRRDFLKLGMVGIAGVTALTLASAASGAVEKTATKARIVIVGAGAAGLAMAARLSERLDGAALTIIDDRARHLYQPGFTLIAAGLKPASYSISATGDYVPRDVNWVQDRVAEFDPESRKVITASGKPVPYDYLVVAAGIDLDYAAIDGMDVSRIGKDGLGSVYHSPEGAAATWNLMAQFAETGGDGVFLRPATEMKCAGAPLKYAFLTDDQLRRKGNRGKANLTYAAHNDALFSVPIVSEKTRMLFKDRGMKTVYNHVLQAIDPGRKRATFASPSGPVELPYDFINVIPPMRAAASVRNSALAWQDGPFAHDGWVEVNRGTLRHPRFANVFAVGDVAGVPKGKTAASIKFQVPVAVDHIVANIAGRDSDSVYGGYTSCPLITRYGRAMLVEFDYNNDLLPSFPRVIAPLEELWVTWVMKTIALKPTYVSMLRGKA
ncbi:MAG: FAD-dependent oxidoreductase [Pseudomonadota bacterium]